MFAIFDGLKIVFMVNKTCVIVHAGAGFHSHAKEKKYSKLCQEACLIASRLLDVESKSAVDAVVAAVTHLEDSHLTNAGIGSNLNVNGCVECDAGIMSGCHLRFCGVGAVQNVRNPIKAANLLLQSQLSEPIGELGRVSPCLLVGDGVRQWASSKGYELDTCHSLVCPSSQRSWERYKKWLMDYQKFGNIESQADKEVNFPVVKKPRYERFDTVGAVCVDQLGNIASAVSSGGIALKYKGRLGQACIYGCGCWAEQLDRSGIGIATTGTGEQLIRTQFAQRTAERLLSFDKPISDLLRTSIVDGFINSKYLSLDQEKYAGLAGICLQPCDNDYAVELFFGHTTKSMSVAHFVSSVMSKPLSFVSRVKSDDPVHIEVFSYR